MERLQEPREKEPGILQDYMEQRIPPIHTGLCCEEEIYCAALSHCDLRSSIIAVSPLTKKSSLQTNNVNVRAKQAHFTFLNVYLYMILKAARMLKNYKVP